MANTRGPKAGPGNINKFGGNRLALMVFGLIALLILLTAGSAIVVTTTQGTSWAQQSIRSDLVSSQSVQTAFQQQRYQRLNLISRIFATDQLLTAYLTEAAQARDEATILVSIQEYQDLLTFDLAVVLDRNGIVLTRTDGRGEAGEDLSDTPLVAVALEESKASGVWQQGEQLYHAVAVPLVRQFELVGYIVVAYSIDNGLATQIERTGGADAVFLTTSPTGPAVAASTLSPSHSSSLIQALRRQGNVLERVIDQGDTADDVELTLGDEDWVAFLSPLRDAGGNAVGATVALTSTGDKVGIFNLIRGLLLAAAAVALVVGLLFSIWVANLQQKPLDALALAAEQGAQGHLEVAVPDSAGATGRIATSFRQLLVSLRERQALEFVVGRLARLLPEPAHSAAQRKPQAQKVALVGIDLQRFANPKIGYDPEENMGRLSRDLNRISTSTSTQKGQLIAVYGHRALALFEGENATFRALTAATEVLLTLSERENVFDEPKPPVVALTSGSVVAGTISWGVQSSTAVAGLPVHQLDSLMREATAGEVYFPKQVYGELAQLVQKAGVQVRAQNGILSPQPLYLLDGESAGRLTGARALSETTTQFPGEGRSLSEFGPGSLLGNRFEILAELGAGAQGIVFKAQDRELGDLVTLKMLRPEVVQNAAHFEQLKRAIARARSIRHANVLSVLDFGEAEGMPFISMEFVRGMTLAYMLEHARMLPIVAGTRLARQVAWGLAAAHGQQLMHSSLKPENILVEGDGTVKLADFGLAMPVRVGAIITNPGFLAPEQLEGRDADSRADFYAFGAVVYSMLTGKLPYPGSTVDEIRQSMASQEPEPPSSVVAEIPSALEETLLKCLAKQPEMRYETAASLIADLDKVRV